MSTCLSPLCFHKVSHILLYRLVSRHLSPHFILFFYIIILRSFCITSHMFHFYNIHVKFISQIIFANCPPKTMPLAPKPNRDAAPRHVHRKTASPISPVYGYAPLSQKERPHTLTSLFSLHGLSANAPCLSMFPRPPTWCPCNRNLPVRCTRLPPYSRWQRWPVWSCSNSRAKR